MVAIFTGLGAGFERGSGSTLGAMGLLGGSSMGRGGEQLFLNAASGNLLISNRDEFLVGRGPDATISRTYNSQGTFPDDNGDRWRQSTDRRMTLHGTANASGSSVSRISADGSEIFYNFNGSHYSTTEGAGAHDKITHSGGVLTWTDGDSQMVERYELIPGTSASFRIAQQSDTDGNSLTFSYGADGKLSRVTAADGAADRNYIEYRWAGNNITQIDTTWLDQSTGQIKTLTRTRYGYDGLNRLTTVTVDLSPENRDVSDLQTYVTTYTYDGSTTRIQSITQSDGSKVEFGYSAFVTGKSTISRVTSIRQWVDAVTSRVTTIDYDTSNRVTTITDPSGAQTRLSYGFSGELLEIQQPALSGGAGQPVTRFEYNTAGDVTRVTRYRDLAQLAAGNAASETRYDYDSSGNATATTDGLGNSVTRSYGARNELLSETSTIATGVTTTTRYVYDSENHLRYVVTAEGRVTEYRYDVHGNLETKIEYPEHAYASSGGGAVIPSGSFEAPEVGSGFVYSPSVAGVQFFSTAGIAGNGSSLGFPSALDGDQVGFVQSRPGGQPGSFTQTLTGLEAGKTYTLKFSLGTPPNRGFTSIAVVVTFDGVVLGPSTSFFPSQDGFQDYTVTFRANGSTGQLQFAAQGASFDYDRATAVDRVHIVDTITEAALNAWRDSLADRSSTKIDVHSYDARGNLVATTSYGAATAAGAASAAEGFSRATYAYDQAGQLLSRFVDGQIAETFTYDGLSRVVSSTDLNGARTNIVFNDAASSTIVSLANGFVETSTYNRLGELINRIDSGHLAAPNSALMTIATASFETPEAGNGYIQNAPADGMFFYGSSGIAGNGSSWNFAPAPDGDQVAYVQATPGPTGIFEYRLSGLVAGAQYAVKFFIGASASHGGATVSLSFNGQFIGSFTPSSTSFQEVTAIFTATQTSGQLWFTGGGAAGSATAIDKVAVILQSGGGETYKYDSRGLLRVAADGTGNRTYFIYDKIGRKVADVSALGDVVEYVYDTLGRVVATARYGKRLSAAQLDVLADPQAPVEMASFRPAADATDLWAWQVYDREGRLLQAIGGDGSVSSYEYDKSNRLIKTVVFAARLSAATVEGFKTAPPAAPVLPAADATKDSVARTFYDKDGMLLGMLDGEGFLSRTIYDKAGQKVEEVAFLNPSAAAHRATGSFDQLLANQTTSADDRRMRYVYDGQGLLRYQINGLNDLIKYNYNSATQVTSTIRFAQSIPETANFTYNAVKKLETDLALNSHPDVRRDWVVYDSGGRTAYTIDAAGGVVRLIYNNVGQVAKTIRYEAGRATAALPSLADMDSWAAGQAANAKNRTTRLYYNSAGDLRFTVDPEGFVSGSEYDADRRLVRTIRWKTKIAVTDADTTQTVAGLVNGAFIDSKNLYDPAGRLSETVDGEGVRRRLDYNANGTLKWETAAFGTTDASRTAFVYDNAGRVTERYFAHGTAEEAVTKSEYDGLGNLIKSIDGNGNATILAYDRLGRLTGQTNAENISAGFEYNAFGERTRATDGRGHSSVYAYDKVGRIVSVTDAEGYVTEMKYTRFGELESATRRATRTASSGAKAPTQSSSSSQVRVGVGANILTNASFDQSGTYVPTPVGRSNSTLPGWTKSNAQAFEQVSAGQFGVAGTHGAYWLDLDSVVKTGRSPVGMNLVSNGSFEVSGTFTATATGRANETLPGWTKTNPEAFEQVQSGQFGIAASDGSYWLDLDSVARTGVETYGSNLVTNGSFELSGSFVETATGRSNTNLPGWTKTNPETFEQVQSTQLGVKASDGLWWLDLDSVPTTTSRTIVGSNLLVNGSFGQTGAYVVTATGRSSATMVGWTKTNPETFEQVASGQMGVTTHDGGFWLDLESIPTTGPQAFGSNLLVNGGFETSGSYVVVASGRANSTLPGWIKTNPEAFEQVETDATDIDGPIEGVYMLDLDSMPISVGGFEGPNLIVNGSFEQSAASYTTTATGRYNELDIPGWTRLNAQGFEQVSSGAGGVNATDGSFYLDMEANGGAESRMDIAQTIHGLAAGQQLSLKFDYANTAGLVFDVEDFENSGSLEVYWNGALVGRVSSHDSTMVTKSFAVTSVEGDNVLRFREIGVSDGQGVYLDNVRLHPNVTPPNLIVNGSFEESAASYTATETGRYNDPALDIPGWTRLNAQGFEQVSSGAGGVNATDGNFYLDMEANGGAESRMDIAQTIHGLAAGQQLSLTFDYANTAGMVFDVEDFENSGALEVYWNGALVGRVSSHDATMVTKGFTVTSVEGDNVLRFREIGVSDGQGVYLDNVRLSRTVLPPNLIINGSFEESAELWADNINGRINDGNIPGWVKSNSGMFEQIRSGNLGITATDGSFYLDMEGGGADSRMDISQTIRGLAAGKALTLKFDFANNAAAGSGALEVYWNGSLIATVASQEAAMSTKTFTVTSKSGDNKLRFREVGTQDGRGVSIDNVRLYDPNPPKVGGNMDIYQKVHNLAAGQVMQLQFDHARLTANTSASFEVWWNETLVATVADGKKSMQTNSYFVTAIEGDNKLRFKGTGTVDGLGAVIDNVRLFATQSPPHGGNMDISQTVANLTAGQVMELQFDHANRTTSASGSFEVWWNNALVATITSTGTTMQTKSYSLVAVDGNNTLRFKGLGTVDAAGASLDNVRLYHTQAVTTGGNMNISQVIPNQVAGQMLQLQFDHANRTTSTSGSFEVLWNGAVVATINSTGTTMQTKTYVVTAVAGNNTLQFRGLGEAEGAGASIDNVRLFAARPVPTGGNMAISQVVPNLAAGQIMQLQFDHANRTSSASGAFQVLWNGAVIATIDSTSTAMQTETYLVTAIGGDNRLEFKAIGTVDADGASIDNVRLFATQADASGGNMVISQDVANLNAGQIFELKFNHANRTTAASGSFEVVWNGNVVATIESSDPVMQTKAYFVTAIAGNNRLEFRGLGTVDGEGASLDNVSLRATELKWVSDELGSEGSQDAVTRFYYDRLGRVTLVRDAEDYLTETVYNRFGDATSVTRRANRTTSPDGTVPTAAASVKDAVTLFEYDQLGRLKQVTDAEGKAESYEMDAFGRRTALVNKLGGRTTYEYDNRGLLVSETLPITSTRSDGQAAPVVNKFEYDRRGNRTRTIEAFGLPEELTTTFHYDKLNRLTKTEGTAVTVLDPNGHVTQSTVTPTETIEYDDAGNVIAMVDALGTRMLFYYDRANRQKAQLNAAGLLTTFDYDGNGNLSSTKSYATPVARPVAAGGPAPTPPAGEFRETIHEYDKLNRLTKTRIPNVRTGAWNGTNYALSTGDLVSTFEHDAHGNVIKSTDANGAVVYVYYDRLRRAVAQVDQENYLTTWEHDSEGNVLTERRAAQRAAWTPTTQAPPTVAAHADDRVTTFSYDKNGRRRFENRANVLSYSVDANGALVENPVKVATIEYRYNGLGLITHKIEATGDTIAYDYDQAGRLVTETHQAYTDQAGNLVKPKVTYTYNGLDLLTQTRQGGETAGPGDRITTNEYVAGRLASTTDATGAKYSYAYDAAGNLLRESYTRQTIGAASLQAASVDEAILYKRDLFGRTTSRSVAAWSGAAWAPGDSQDMEYNIFGEVSRRGTNGKGQEQFNYDKAGRLMSTNSGDGVWRFFVQDRNGNQTLAIESEGLDLAGKSLDEVLTIASGGSSSVGGAYAADINLSFTVYDQRGLATETRLPHRELNATDSRVELVLSRDLNAFGEVSAERDAKGALTNFTYNTMGRTISIARPIVASTSEAGADTEAQPVETLYFDLAGRLVGSRDANGNAITRHLLAGTGYGGTEALTVTEFHADGGRVQNRYDVFGDLRVAINEVNRTASMAYDARGRLVRLDKASGLVEHFVYDLLGQRIKHWNSLLLETNAEITEYDMQGRIRSQRAFGGDITTTAYQWSSTLATDGMGTFGGWIETTTYANARQKIEHSDVFGRAVQKQDLGGHVFTMKYDKAARLVEQRGDETMTWAYLNSGMVGSVTTSRRNSSGVMEPWETTYGYDRNGNKVREQLKRNGALLQNASAEYDSLNRLTLWTEAGTATTPYARVAYKYDANSNIRMIHADYAGLDGFGQMTGISSKEHWYRYDAMNRVVVSKGVFGANGIVGGPEGVEIGYDQSGQRVRTLRSEQRMGQVFAPPPWNVHVIMPYTHEIVETYKYDSAGHLDQVFTAESTVSWNNGFIVTRPAEPGTLKADYEYDALGRLKSQRDYKGANDVAYERIVTDYNASGQIFQEVTVSKQEVPNSQTGAKEWTTFRTETKYYYGGETQTAEERANEGEIGPDALGGVVKSVNKHLRNGALTHWSVTDTAYNWWEGAVQAVVSHRADLWDPSKDSHSLYTYNAWGQLEKVTINDGRRREVSFTNNLSGEAIRRDEQDSNGAGDPHEVWHRFNGRQMGYVGNNGTLNIDYQSSINARTRFTGNSTGAFRLGDGNPTPHADFDQNYSAINSFNQGSSGGTYTARAGDTLSSIASQLWGDASLWYKIAEANGLGAGSGLSEGQNLTIPVGVFKIQHNASTFMPFDPAGVLGDLSPTQPAPPTPVVKKNKCGVFGQILLIAVAVAVTFLTYGALIGTVGVAATGTTAATAGTGLAGALGATGGAIAAGAIAGAAGAIASQTLGVLTGIQEKFDWKGVAMSALSGAIGGGLGKVFDKLSFLKPSGGRFADFARNVVRGAVASTVTQGLGVATRLQGRFSWAGVASSGLGAGVGQLVGDELGALPIDPYNNSFGNYVDNALASGAGAIASSAAKSLIDGSDFGDNVLGGLAGIIGDTIGNLYAFGITFPKRFDVDTPLPFQGVALGPPVEIAQQGGGLPPPQRVVLFGEDMGEVVKGGTEVWEFRWAKGKFRWAWNRMAKELGYDPNSNEHFGEIADELHYAAYGTYMSEKKLGEVWKYLEVRLAAEAAADRYPYMRRGVVDFNALSQMDKRVVFAPPPPPKIVPWGRTIFSEIRNYSTPGWGPGALGKIRHFDYKQAGINFVTAFGKGEFDDTPGFSAGAGRFTSSLIPIGDLRDTGAALNAFRNGEPGSGWGLLATGVGYVPLFGDIIKFGGKSVIRSTFKQADVIPMGNPAPNGFGLSSPQMSFVGAPSGGGGLPGGGFGGGFGGGRGGGLGGGTPDGPMFGPHRGNGDYYSSAFEMRLDDAVWGKSDSVHFNRANEALDNAMKADPEFAAQMETLIPGVGRAVSSVGRRKTPEGWVWHHARADNRGGGYLQLVPKPQHTAGSIFWDTLHPPGPLRTDGRGYGGYFEWARPAGARDRHKR